MKGNNALILNKATMIEAIQMWLDAKFKEGQQPKCISVQIHVDDDDLFVIDVTADEPTKKE